MSAREQAAKIVSAIVEGYTIAPGENDERVRQLYLQHFEDELTKAIEERDVLAATLQHIVELAAQSALEAADPPVVLPIWGVRLTYPPTRAIFVIHVHATDEDDARAQARKLEPNAEIGMAELAEGAL